MRPLLPLAVALVMVTAGMSQAVFVESAVTVPGSFKATTLAAPTGVTATVSTDGRVELSWIATPSTRATGHRVLRSIQSSGPYTQIAQIAGLTTTTFTDNPGPGTYSYVVRSYYAANGADWFSPDSTAAIVTVTHRPYVFTSTPHATGVNCASGQRQRVMQQGFVPTNPEETLTRTGGVGTISFCTAAFAGGETLAAGTTSVAAYFHNTSGSTCAITATVYLNGTTALGSATITIAASTPLSLRTWSFATTGTTLAPGDRLNLRLAWQNVKSCDTTFLHYDGAATDSRVLLPPISTP